MKKIESYVIDKKLYVTTAFISEYFKTDTRNIRNWTKRGLPSREEQGIRSNLFVLEETIEWVKTNINQAKSHTSREKKISIEPQQGEATLEKQINDIQGKIKLVNEKLQIDGTGYEEAERISKIIDALTKTVKLGEQTKDLIPKKDTEKVIIEFIITLIAGYKKDIKILPKELARRDEKTIKEILENNYKSSIAKYQKMAKSKIVSEGRLYDVVEVVFGLLQDEVEVEEIIKKLKG